MKKIISIIVSLLFIVIIIRLFFFIITIQEDSKLKEIASNEATVEGKITYIGNFKGAHIEVEYFVENKKYFIRQGISTKILSKVTVGQKVPVNFSNKNPSIGIVKIEE